MPELRSTSVRWEGVLAASHEAVRLSRELNSRYLSAGSRARYPACEPDHAHSSTIFVECHDQDASHHDIARKVGHLLGELGQTGLYRRTKDFDAVGIVVARDGYFQPPRTLKLIVADTARAEAYAANEEPMTVGVTREITRDLFENVGLYGQHVLADVVQYVDVEVARLVEARRAETAPARRLLARLAATAHELPGAVY